jgi:CheY-like chemotaxis protein
MHNLLSIKADMSAENFQNTTYHQPLSVGLLGFEPADQEKLLRALQTQHPEGRIYQALSPSENSDVDIVMVNYDNPNARLEKDTLLVSHPQLQVVAVSRGPLDDAPTHHIRGMLVAARVLGVLDKVPVNKTVPVTEVLGGNGGATQNHYFKAPVAPILPEHIPKPVTAVGSVAEPSGYRTLVVDDSAAIQKSLQIHLATISQIAVIDFASSGEEALEKCAAKQYDVIFLDIMMPGIDGYETCALLRKKPEYKKIPIIMVSGKTSPLDEVKGVVAGCTTYLTKPVQPDAFQKLSIRVLTWLERQKKT